MRIKDRLRSHASSMFSFEPLSTHRFASHVCQTMFTVAKDVVSREVNSISFLGQVAHCISSERPGVYYLEYRRVQSMANCAP